MPGIEDFATQAGQQALGGILGIALGGLANRQQYNQQERLQGMQIRGQKEMTDYNALKQLEIWKATGPTGQMEQLKKAGLNPGLIYGMGGAGGQTAGITPGNVTGGNAANNAGMAVQMASTMAQLGLLKAQKENIEADTANKTATTPKIQAETASITQGIENQKAAAELIDAQRYATNVMSDINARSSNSQVASAMRRVEQETEEVRRMMRENNINDQTIQEKIDQIKAESLGAGIENALKQQGILTQQAQIAKMIQDVAQGWQKLSLEERNTKVAEKLAEISGGKFTLEKQQTLIRLVEGMMSRLMPSAGTIINAIKPAL